MRIIQLVYSLCSGGAEKFVVNLANSLADAGHDVEVCMLLDDTDSERMFNKVFLKQTVHFHCMHFSRGFSLSKKRIVEAYIKSQRPEIVHCHLNVIPYIFSLALLNNHIRFIHTLHSVAEVSAGSKYQYCFNRYFYKKRLIQPVTISLKCQDSYIQFYRLNNAPFIDNGCAAISSSSKYTEVQKEIEALKNGKDIPVFIHVARFHPLKNQTLLVDAFNKLYQEGLDYLLLVVGNGFSADEAVNLRERACSSIVFLGEKKNVGDYLLCSDAFCLTSNFEGLPISLLEALSAGITPICTPVGGIPDVIEDGVTGYLSEEINIASYVATVHRFLKKRLDSNQLRKHFTENYSMKACMEKYLAVYRGESF